MLEENEEDMELRKGREEERKGRKDNMENTRRFYCKDCNRTLASQGTYNISAILIFTTVFLKKSRLR